MPLMKRIAAALLALQALALLNAGTSTAEDNNITVTAAQEGTDLVVSWTPVPPAKLPPSNAGGPWTAQVYYVWAWDMSNPTPDLYYLCDGTTRRPGQAGFPRTTETRCVMRQLPMGRTYNVFVRSWVYNDGTNTGMAGWGDLWAQGGVTMCCSIPSPPRDVRLIEAGRGAVSAVWSPSAETGGAASVTYAVTLNPGGRPCATSGTECLFSGLDAGVAFSASVRALNQAGSSEPVSSTAIELRPPPVSAPRDVKVTPAPAGLRVSWSSPRLASGQKVARYVAKATPTGRSCTTRRTSCTITGLGQGRTYTVTVTLLDTAGGRAASSASRSVTMPVATQPRPVQAPAAPAKAPDKPTVSIS